MKWVSRKTWVLFAVCIMFAMLIHIVIKTRAEATPQPTKSDEFHRTPRFLVAAQGEQT